MMVLVIITWEYISGKISNPFRIQSKETVHDIVLQKVKDLGQLELASFSFKDIVEQKLTRDFLPDPKALLIVYGEATGCIDLTKITDKEIEVFKDSVHITLPTPVLCQYKIDHSKSRIYDSEYAFMNEALLFEEAYKSAENKLKESALQSGIIEKSKENAETLLKPLFENISGKKIGLSFKR